MSKSNKLQNIKAVQQMIDGTHAFQTKKSVGFSDATEQARKSERHEIGEVWEETSPNGITWVIEQRDGFRVKKTKNTDVIQELRDELNSFVNCPKETCTCLKPNNADIKMRKIHGLCLDCTIDMEHELKKSGKYEEYEKNKIRENALAWLASAERDVVMLKEAYTTASQFVTNSEGEKETWTAKMTPEEFDETVQKQFDTFKENFLKRLNGEHDETIS
jgi:hypothetical protein